MTPYLLVGEVAARYRCSVWTIQQRAKAGTLPHRKFAGGSSRLVFIPAWLDAYDAGAALEVTETPGGGRVVRPIT